LPSGGYVELKNWWYEPATTQWQIGSGDRIWVTPNIDPSIKEAIEEGVYPAPDNFGLVFFKKRWNSIDDGSGGQAKLNEHAKWVDRKYNIKIEAVDIAEHKSIKEEEIILDNFRPYVQKVIIGDNYSREWLFDGTNLNSPAPTKNIPLDFGTYPITITFSEPVTSTTLKINTFDNPITLSSSDPADDQKTWTGVITIPDKDESHDGERTMTISATDLAGNKTLILTPDKSQINPATELTRDANGAMQGAGGEDVLHKFKIRSSIRVTCTPMSQIIKIKETKSHTITIKNFDSDKNASFDIAITSTNNNEEWTIDPVSFNNVSVPANDSASWKFNVKNITSKGHVTITINVTNKETGEIFTLNNVIDNSGEENTFSVKCLPPMLTIKKGQSGSHTITITNSNQTDPAIFDIDISYSGPGWAVSPGAFKDVSVPANGSISIDFKAGNGGMVRETI
jgi:hypothetical protein